VHFCFTNRWGSREHWFSDIGSSESCTGKGSVNSSFLSRFEENASRQDTVHASLAFGCVLDMNPLCNWRQKTLSLQLFGQAKARRGGGKLDRKAGRSAASCCISFSSVTSAARRGAGSETRSAAIGKLNNHDVSPFQSHTSRTRSSGGLCQP
jgi:hypothetical protein